MNETESILGLLKALCGEIAELRMAVENRNGEEKSYTPKEASEYLRISYWVLLKRANSGLIPGARKNGGKWTFSLKGLKKYAGNQI